MTLTRASMMAGAVLLSPLIYFSIEFYVLEPLGYLDIHAAQVPEGHGCVKVSEQWYRYCWDFRERGVALGKESQGLIEARSP